MFSVDGVPILADELSVVEELKAELEKQGIFRFHKIRDGVTDIMTTCPFHRGGAERKPSFGICKQSPMLCHCFSCGWVGTLDMVISLCFGYDDWGYFGREWLLKRFVSVSVAERKPLELDLSRSHEKTSKTIVSEAELSRYRYYHPYMYQRGLTDELIERFDIGYDRGSECITIPVADIDKDIVFVARRSVKGKFFHYPSGSEKPIYCVDRVVADSNIDTVIITESAFNTLTCWKFGKPSVALFGTGAENQYEVLKNLPVRKYILALDPDSAGEYGTQKLIAKLKAFKILTRLIIPAGKDLNDLDKDFLKLPEIFC